ncbi:MAG: class I SAM-dependent methyltransferase [Acidobacteriota bacterium]|jgi:Cyclopropane fatty acid synthase and related methyltransferases|nr:class I SAM-dependent methyltransferase [Acidobacteriota bacterium]OQB58498.1 MAG: Demethylrebeccamycin-D-glucose O-methyltransferase [Candidatus Aminicenantes bacterium ADurb.Bin147]HNQ80997.1 class I SAM-dependent methyltransferase [Candidatus Aminicenantes bacterium]MDD8040028.1 class I SAM-dependent methyltransferase [Acidobacteriota bacterium]MDW3227209.1 class I SAM-dependent methyltransferase [Acidobacteriota bacterium]
MNKRLMIALAAVFCLAAALLIYFGGRPSAGGPAVGTVQEESIPSFLGVGPHEITIRNVTKKPVHYRLRAYGSEAPAVERMLLPDEIDRYPAPQTVVISYLKYGSEVTYSLFPGKPYSFRYDSAGNTDIWVGAHGREDAVDLAPYVPTPPEVLAEMCLLGEVTKDSIVYDIGCGDGRIVIHAAKTFGARGVGIDIEPERIRESKANAKAAGVERLVRFKLADATKVDISEATVVTMYLLPESNELLRPKLEKELRPGVLVVTHNYMIPGWENKEVTSKIVLDSEEKEHTIFVYRR